MPSSKSSLPVTSSMLGGQCDWTRSSAPGGCLPCCDSLGKPAHCTRTTAPWNYESPAHPCVRGGAARSSDPGIRAQQMGIELSRSVRDAPFRFDLRMCNSAPPVFPKLGCMVFCLAHSTAIQRSERSRASHDCWNLFWRRRSRSLQPAGLGS